MNDVVERLKEGKAVTMESVGMVKAFMEGCLPLYIIGPELRDDTIEEIERLRQFFEAMAADVWDLHTIDGGDFQDTAEKLGLIVRVPASEEFREEFGADEMLVWSWNQLALEEK